MNFLNVITTIYSNFISKLKSFPLFDNELFNQVLIDQRHKITIENFNQFLTFYGLNPVLLSNSFVKWWNYSLILSFGLGLIKTILALHLNPITNYKWCIYLGDVSLLFRSLRKFLLIILSLYMSFAIFTNYLFSQNTDTHWLEVFKCFDGTLIPKSIGIKDKKILVKMIILTKFAIKSVKIMTISFTVISTCFLFYLFMKRIHINDELELFFCLFWFISTIIGIYFVSGTMFTSNFCFQLICFYCFINFRYFNKLINNFNFEISFGCRRFIMNMKIKTLINKQNEFSNRILKYNKFWRKFYLILMMHILPANIILLQQVLYGQLGFQIKILYAICFVCGIIFIVSSSILVCLLANEIKIYQKKLIQIQLKPYLNLDTMTKLKVSQQNVNWILIAKFIYFSC